VCVCVCVCVGNVISEPMSLPCVRDMESACGDNGKFVFMFMFVCVCVCVCVCR
jgi:hypothetical protein